MKGLKTHSPSRIKTVLNLLCWEIHNGASEAPVLLALEGFSHVITFHAIHWAVLNLDIALQMLFRNEEASDLDMPGALAH